MRLFDARFRSPNARKPWKNTLGMPVTPNSFSNGTEDRGAFARSNPSRQESSLRLGHGGRNLWPQRDVSGRSGSANAKIRGRSAGEHDGVDGGSGDPGAAVSSRRWTTAESSTA